MSEYPSDWSRTTFGNVLNQRKESGFTNEDLLAVTSSLGIVKRDTLERRDTSNEDKSKYLLVNEGDIAYNTMRMWQGVSGVSRFRGIVSPAYTICTPTERLDAGFAGYLLKDPEMVSVFRQRSQGLVSDTWNLKYESFAQIPCAIPPLPEQKKIAEILSGIDALSEKITTQITKLENLKVALICEFLSEGARKAEMTSSDGGDFQGNCEWKMLPVSAIADFISGYAFSSTDFIDTGILCIRMGNLYQNKFHENRASVFLPSEYLTKHPRFQVEAGDLLISMTGTAGKRDYGFVVEVPDGTSKGLLNQRVGKIVTKTNHSKGYIKEVMRSPFYLEQLYEYGSGTKQANLTAGQIMGVIFPVPNLPTQLRIAQSLSSIQKNIDSLAVLSCKQIELLLSIRNELLSGRKRVSDARVLEGVGI
jgi:type I restriction enzyme, S subunit